MAEDTSTLRNAQGETFEDWLETEYESAKANQIYDDIAIDDIVIGRDVATGVQGFSLSDLGIIVGHVNKPIMPTMSDTMTSVNGMYGAVYGGTSYGAKTFTIPYTIVADTNEEYQYIIQQLTNNLVINKTYEAKETTLIFGDNPGVTWTGHFSDIASPTFIHEGSFDSSGTLTFVASRPLGALTANSGEAIPNELVTFTDSVKTVNVTGNAPASPIIHVSPNTGATPLTRFGYQIGDNPLDRVVVGQSLNANTMQDTKPVVYRDDMESLDGWATITSNDNIGYSLGTDTTLTAGSLKVSSNKSSIVLDKFSADETKFSTKGKWHGVLIQNKQGFSNNLTNDNWEITVNMGHYKRYGRATQGIEGYLLDANGKRRLRFGVRDGEKGDYPTGYIRFGQDFNSESKATGTGLGDGNIRATNAKNSKNVTIKLDSTVKTNSYESNKVTQKKVRTYYFATHIDTYTETTTKVSTMNTSTKKISTTTTKSPTLKSVKSISNTPHQYTDYVVYAGANKVATKQYFNKGDYKRANNHHAGAIDKKHKYTAKTLKKMYLVNKTVYTTTEVDDSKNGKQTTTTKVLTYVNGKKPSAGKVGALIGSTKTVSSKVDTTNHKSEVVYKPKTYSLVDANNDNILTSARIQFTIGSDSKGFYWEVVALDDSGLQIGGKPLVSKTYDKRPNLHTGYKFTPDKIAFLFKKMAIEEDELNPKTSKPVKSYTDDYLNVSYVVARKLVKPLTQTDLIILKPGQEAIFDGSTRNFYIDGKKRNDLVNPDSTWPMLQGGEDNDIHLTFNPSDGYSTIMQYRGKIY